MQFPRAAQALRRAADEVYRVLPQPTPPRERLRACKLIAHRGAHDRSHLENTLPAFEQAAQAGVWGLECDVRWTRDLHPVIFHDPDGQRLFHDPARLSTLTLAEVRRRFPLIPTLPELLARHGGRQHLMIELKAEPYPDPAYQRDVLQRLLTDLEPGRDYHLLSLDPALFTYAPFIPAAAQVGVSLINAGAISQATIQAGLGGITGHYLLLTHRLLDRHRRLGQRIGTGFVDSRNVLFRELNRGIEWIFTNNAVALAAVRHRYSE